MERISISMQSLFMLLVAVHVTTACSCQWRPLAAFLCDSQSTVIRARVLSAKVIDLSGNPVPEELTNDFNFMYNLALTRYKIQLQKTFKEGPVHISTRDAIFEMTAPRGDSLCGFVLTTDVDYLLAGITSHGGEFHTDVCEKIARWDDISETNLSLLEHRSVPDCEYVKDNMFPFKKRT